MRGELSPLGCRLTRGEGDGLERISGTRERAGDGESTDRGTRLPEESDRSTRPDRDGWSTCGTVRGDELRFTRDSERSGADDVLEERLSRITGPLSIELFRCCRVPRSDERVFESPRSGADVVAREPRMEPPRSTLLLRGSSLPLLPRSGAV